MDDLSDILSGAGSASSSFTRVATFEAMACKHYKR